MFGQRRFRHCRNNEVTVEVEAGSSTGDRSYSARVDCPNKSATGTEVRGLTKEVLARHSLKIEMGKLACGDCRFAKMTPEEVNREKTVQLSAETARMKAEQANLEARLALEKAQAEAAEAVNDINKRKLGPAQAGITEITAAEVPLEKPDNLQ